MTTAIEAGGIRIECQTIATQEALAAWMRSNGIDVKHVLLDQTVCIEDVAGLKVITYTEAELDENGKYIVEDGRRGLGTVLRTAIRQHPLTEPLTLEELVKDAIS